MLQEVIIEVIRNKLQTFNWESIFAANRMKTYMESIRYVCLYRVAYSQRRFVNYVSHEFLYSHIANYNDDDWLPAIYLYR